ncbi:ATP-binding protein [Vibrio cholerae]|uniref:ATP-binding protein n=1 Tax=Vibrio cholerae TaxID=666 RepID=UPI0011583CB7|nr:ATP-binding protein [Vibrio cholerae]EGR3952189.1 ATP-binding protein [Vibrio cholerae]EIJ0939292.1 ATP-binding protein [Vibrio cholerae]EJL6318309.1 ATP-binding protein [Vibrio cholerae]EKF9306773.1 ATP-binding protein [Vibrio cholerae]ELC0993104.1 ATP-binding protein [Vibrio cholerae]
MRCEDAIYHEAILPEHRGNPLIEALPPKVEDDELVIKLSNYPERLIEETKLETIERLDYLTRLKTLRQPLPLYFDVFRAIEMAIKEGYSAKNPLSPTTMNYLHYSSDNRPDVEPRTGFFKPKGSGITIIGESGVGKTCMLEQVLNCFPDVIEHRYYQNKVLAIPQVVWIKVDCPDDSSVKGLCHRILEQIDQKLGHTPTTPAGTIALLLQQIESKMKSNFLGILVIDEMQNLNLAKAGGADRLLGFLHNLVNNLGIPILFCANPPFDELLSKSFKSARRAESSGYFDVELMKNDDEWELFVDELWCLQWTNVETPLTPSLNNKLYSLSAGNMDLAVRIYYSAQKAVIGSSDERITEEVLELGASIAIRATKKLTEEMRKKHAISILKRNRQDGSSGANNHLREDGSSKEVINTKSKTITIPGDLTRPHHPEFFEELTELVFAEDLSDRILDTNLIERASQGSDPLENLRASGVLCDNPLETFS